MCFDCAGYDEIRLIKVPTKDEKENLFHQVGHMLQRSSFVKFSPANPTHK